MVRVFGAFLLVFFLLGLVVHLNGLAQLFGLAAVGLFAVDLLSTNVTSNPRAPGARRHSL